MNTVVHILTDVGTNTHKMVFKTLNHVKRIKVNASKTLSAAAECVECKSVFQYLTLAKRHTTQCTHCQTQGQCHE